MNVSQSRLTTGSEKGLPLAKMKFLTNGSKQSEVQKRSKTGNLANFSPDGSLTELKTSVYVLYIEAPAFSWQDVDACVYLHVCVCKYMYTWA